MGASISKTWRSLLGEPRPDSAAPYGEQSQRDGIPQLTHRQESERNRSFSGSDSGSGSGRGSRRSTRRRTLGRSRRFSRIALELDSFNLILGIDFSRSNERTGERSFNGKSLHNIEDGSNHYELAISTIGKAFAVYNEDNLIPCLAFGDATHDQDVFRFYQDGRFCNGFEDVLSRYRELLPYILLAGPTSFAPIIEMAMTLVEESGGKYHVLLIITDGQLPLSIITVGVGDGPWSIMEDLSHIPARGFDNFKLVNFTEILSKFTAPSRRANGFALAALSDITSQYQAILELDILGKRKGNVATRVALPPPTYSSSSRPGFQLRAPSYTDDSSDNSGSLKRCPVCRSNSSNMALGCGHMLCEGCANNPGLRKKRPICRRPIQSKLKLFS